jgi:hypothetical protein
MSGPRNGNRFVTPQELQAIVVQSGLSVHAFSRVMGMSCSSLQGKLTGKQPIQEYVLHAARFSLLRLGISVKAPPVDWSAIRGNRSKP